jgi:hypothetical protein
MTHFRLAAVAAMASLALLLVGGAGTAAAQDPVTSLTDPIAMTGTAKNGKKFTDGTFKVKRFVAEGGKVFAVGTLKGTLKHRSVRRTGVKIPVSGTTFGEIDGAQASQAELCQVLDLTLGPLDLNLLGLIVHLDQVHLDIDADPAGGLLGSLLCSLAGGIPPTPAPGVADIVALLNAILAILQGL